MMYTYLVVVMLASSASCLSVPNVVSNSPTHVPSRCLLDVAKGTCRDQTRNFYFNVSAGSCQPFIYNGCGGNWNRFTALSDCHKTCTCALPPETGPCRGYEARWFYSPADGCCRPFMYGGCGGNSNSYSSWRTCSNACGYPSANSSWWAWGAQWGNATASRSNTTYSQNDFMRDWMMWMLMSSGEGFEMEDMAALIAQAHMIGMGNTNGNGQFARGLGAFKGFGSQTGGRGMSSAFANGLFDADAMEGQYRTANFGAARTGSFTPLGHVGSANNLVNRGGVMSGNGGFLDSMNMFGGQGGGPFWDTQGMFGQGLFDADAGIFGQGQLGAGAGMFGQGQLGAGAGMFGQGQLGAGAGMFGQEQFGAKAGMFGQGQFGAGSGMFGQGQLGSHNQGSAWGNTNFGSQAMFTGHRQQQIGHPQSNVPIFENIVMEILYYIRKLGRGELGHEELMNLGKRFGAISSTGKLNINLLASEMVKELQGKTASSNFASIQGIAQSVGAFDRNGNINIPQLVNTLTQNMSDNQFTQLLKFGIPSTDEFNWLSKRADVTRTRIGAGGGKGGRTRGSSVTGGRQAGKIGASGGIQSGGSRGTVGDVTVVNLGTSGSDVSRDITPLLGGVAGVMSRTGSGSRRTPLGTSEVSSASGLRSRWTGRLGGTAMTSGDTGRGLNRGGAGGTRGLLGGRGMNRGSSGAGGTRGLSGDSGSLGGRGSNRGSSAAGGTRGLGSDRGLLGGRGIDRGSSGGGGTRGLGGGSGLLGGRGINRGSSGGGGRGLGGDSGLLGGRGINRGSSGGGGRGLGGDSGLLGGRGISRGSSGGGGRGLGSGSGLLGGRGISRGSSGGGGRGLGSGSGLLGGRGISRGSSGGGGRGLGSGSGLLGGRGISRGSSGGGGRGLGGDSGRLAGLGGTGVLGGGLGGIDGITLGGGEGGGGGFNTGGMGGSAFGGGRAAVVVSAGKSTRLGSYGKK